MIVKTNGFGPSRQFLHAQKLKTYFNDGEMGYNVFCSVKAYCPSLKFALRQTCKCILVVEKSYTSKCHCHAVVVGGFDYLVVAYASAWLSYNCNT